MQVDPVSKMSPPFICLQISAVFFGAVSVISHSYLQNLSEMTRNLTIGLGLCVLLRMANHAAIQFPRIVRVAIRWMHAMIFEVLALISIFFLRFLHLFQKNPTLNKNATKIPVLLVHGYCDHGSVWTYLKNRLGNNQRLYTIHLGSPFHSILDYAKKVQKKAAQIRQETNCQELILIGHSMGGLVSAAYAMEFAPKNSVTDVITIGSPLKGTYSAKIGIGQSARDMEPFSPFIQNLNQQIAQEKQIRFYHIGTETDQLIIPSSSALMQNNQDREFMFKDLGHVSLLFSSRVVRILDHWLENRGSLPNNRNLQP